MTKKDIFRFLILKAIGNFLVLFALYGVSATFGPAIYYEIQYQVIQAKGIRYTVEAGIPLASSQTTDPSLPNLFFTDTTNQIMIPKDTNFSILIPKLGANAKIFPNIDPANEDQYRAVLKEGVAHAAGSVFPGIPGTIYLFAHSTDNFWDVGRYNAIFYLLKDLDKGDSITLFYNNKRYDYQVSDKKIVDANDVSYLVNSQKSETQLILQTCWPPGTTWKRLMVFARPIE